jgi:hypothetical protein
MDLPFAPTFLRAFELPPGGTTEDQPTAFVAAAGGGGGWTGAALYVDRAGELIPIGRTGRAGATIGRLAAPLGQSAAMLFEPQATLEIELLDGGAFPSASLTSLLMGANRLLVGDEAVQFALADQTGPTTWRLTGLLRGRGGTEAAALAGHPAGTDAILIDDALVALDPAVVPVGAGTMIAAIGAGDPEPVYAALANAGLGRAPLTPVHPKRSERDDRGLALEWTRRARGSWAWLDGVEVPLVEESELYRVGLGPAAQPFAEWLTAEPRISLDGETRAALVLLHPGSSLWVRQVGRHAQSDPLLLGPLG